VLRGEVSIAEAARVNKVSATSVAKWREQFVRAGADALAAAAATGPSGREAQLERELAEVTTALGEATVELRLLKRDGVGFPGRILR
jgi:transposase